MADKYKRVNKPREKAPDTEVRINKQTPVTNYVRYVLTLFREKDQKIVVLKTMGDAISKIITVAEIVKYRVKGLYQQNDISTTEFEDIYEPLEEGLDTLTFKRKVTSFQVILSKEAQDRSHHGFQEPIDESLVEEDRPLPRAFQDRYRRDGERGGFRGRRGFRGGFRGGRDRDRGGDRYRDNRGGDRNRDRDNYRPPRDRDYDRPPRDRDYDRPPRDRDYDRPQRDRDYDRPPRDRENDRPRGGRGGYNRPPRGGDRDYERPQRDRGGDYDRPQRDREYDRPPRNYRDDRPPRDLDRDDRYYDRPRGGGGGRGRGQRDYEDRPPRGSRGGRRGSGPPQQTHGD